MTKAYACDFQNKNPCSHAPKEVEILIFDESLNDDWYKK